MHEVRRRQCERPDLRLRSVRQRKAVRRRMSGVIQVQPRGRARIDPPCALRSHIDEGSIAKMGDGSGRVEVHADHRDPFKGRHFPGTVILLCVRWYLRYPLAYEHVAELLAERGVEVDPSCIWRWVQTYAPELNKRCRPYLKPTNKSYHTDETYITVKGEDKYLYRAVDSTGQTIEFLLTAKRDAAAAKRFFRKALSSPGNPVPRVINVDKNPAFRRRWKP